MRIDHLVMGTTSLEAGRAWLEDHLGARAQPGGAHARMGTHNLLWSLGPETYLELIAVDPAAPAPDRARWFGLDEPAVQKSLAAQPRLIGWAIATEDLDHAILRAPLPLGERLSMSRGDFSWSLTFPAHAGIRPFLIQWNGAAPAARLPDSGLRLNRLILRAPETAALAAQLKALDADHLAQIEKSAFGGESMMAEIMTPEGAVSLMS